MQYLHLPHHRPGGRPESGLVLLGLGSATRTHERVERPCLWLSGIGSVLRRRRRDRGTPSWHSPYRLFALKTCKEPDAPSSIAHFALVWDRWKISTLNRIVLDIVQGILSIHGSGYLTLRSHSNGYAIETPSGNLSTGTGTRMSSAFRGHGGESPRDGAWICVELCATAAVDPPQRIAQATRRTQLYRSDGGSSSWPVSSLTMHLAIAVPETDDPPRPPYLEYRGFRSG